MSGTKNNFRGMLMRLTTVSAPINTIINTHNELIHALLSTNIHSR